MHFGHVMMQGIWADKREILRTSPMDSTEIHGSSSQQGQQEIIFGLGSQTHKFRVRTAAATDHFIIVSSSPTETRFNRQHGRMQAVLTATRAETQITVQPSRFLAPPCPVCGRNHPPSVPCASMPRNDVRSVAERILQKQRSYVIPSYINDKEVHVLRDTGGLLVDETFASPEQIIPGRMVQVNGAFDTNFRTFPVAKIEYKCRRIGLDRNIVFEAVVTKFSDGLHCIIENKFFTELPFLCDIYLHISNQLWCRHAAHRAPASPPRELTDTPDRVDSLIECDGRGHSTTAGDVILPPGGDSERLTAARRDNTAVTPSHQVDAYHNTDDDRPSALMNNAAARQMRETHTRLVSLHKPVELTWTLFTTTRVTQNRQAETPSAAKCTN